MGTIEEIISAIDEELISTGKDYLTLAQANKLLVDEGIMSIPEKTNQEFKRLLESDKIVYAFQTKSSPIQWRIPYSEGKSKLAAKHREKKNAIIVENEFSQNFATKNNDHIICPQCGVFMDFPQVLKNKAYLKCLTCGETFKNPFLRTNNKNSTRQRNWIIGIVTFVALFFYLKSPSNDSGQNSSPTIFFINKESFAATSKESFDKMYRYSLDGDYEALSTLFQTGEVVTLKAGAEVFIVSAHFGYHEVRLRGSTQSLYVAMENITQK